MKSEKSSCLLQSVIGRWKEAEGGEDRQKDQRQGGTGKQDEKNFKQDFSKKVKRKHRW